MGKFGEPGLVKHAGYLAEQIYCDAMGFDELDTKCIQSEHRPSGEPATPFGIGGFVRSSDS